MGLQSWRLGAMEGPTPVLELVGEGAGAGAGAAGVGGVGGVGGSELVRVGLLGVLLACIGLAVLGLVGGGVWVQACLPASLTFAALLAFLVGVDGSHGAGADRVLRGVVLLVVSLGVILVVGVGSEYGVVFGLPVTFLGLCGVAFLWLGLLGMVGR